MFVSIVITLKNEAETIRSVLDSLIAQDPPFEIILVDAKSEDDTQRIIKEYSKKYDFIRLFTHAGSRGNGRNYGILKAKGPIVAFTDGGCIAEPQWLSSIREKIEEGYDIVAGKTINFGPFKQIQRVEVIEHGYDITWPSCNLAYKKELFKKIGGFDEHFVTAEDIDLNFNAVNAGASIGYAEDAIIHRSSATTLYSFIRQSFWYGYGRKQLTLKHGKLWKSYSINQMFDTQLTMQGLIRLLFGFLGYLACKIQKGIPQ